MSKRGLIGSQWFSQNKSNWHMMTYNNYTHTKSDLSLAYIQSDSTCTPVFSDLINWH